LIILHQLAECTDLSSPILLFYDPSPALSASSAKELPIQIYEFAQSTAATDGDTFVKGTFDVQTSEAERIAVDCVAKPNAGSKENERAYCESTTGK
jgi:predicted transcriptional regulator of viral defense system